MPNKPKGIYRPWMIKNKESYGFNQRLKKRDPRYKTKRWQNLRLETLREQPFCKECEKKGRTSASVICDHIDNIKREIDFWDKSNLQGLCVKCHNRKSQRERNDVR